MECEEEIKETLEFLLRKIEQEEEEEEFEEICRKKIDSNPFDFEVLCDSCKSRESIFWRRVTPVKIVCNKCFFTKIYLLSFCDSVSKGEQNQVVNETKARTKRSNRKVAEAKSTKSNKVCSFSSQMSSCSSSASSHSVRLNKAVEDYEKQAKNLRNRKMCEKKSEAKKRHVEEGEGNEATKEMSRRSKVFKVETPAPSKCEVLVSTIHTSDFVFHRGFYMQVGDVVALFDMNDKDSVYFAQIRAFLTDQYGEKSAVITWLIPVEGWLHKEMKTGQDFDPDMFMLGPAEDLPRPLDCMEFVCRLVECADVKQRHRRFDEKNQFQNDLLRHKFALNDLAEANFKLITNKNKAENQIEHSVKFC